MLRYVSTRRTTHKLEELTVDVPVPESYELITSGGLSLHNKCVNGESTAESSMQSDKDPPLPETINKSCLFSLIKPADFAPSWEASLLKSSRRGMPGLPSHKTEVPWA